MLLHNVSTRTLGILWCIFVMNENFRIHAYRYDPPQIAESLVTDVTIIAAPITQTHHWAVMFLKRFHFCPVLYVYCEYGTLAVTYKQFSLTRVEDHAC